eukprot:155969_1
MSNNLILRLKNADKRLLIAIYNYFVDIMQHNDSKLDVVTKTSLQKIIKSLQVIIASNDNKIPPVTFTLDLLYESFNKHIHANKNIQLNYNYYINQIVQSRTKFFQFINILQKRNFFRGIDKHSLEYQHRMLKAKTNYNKRFPNMKINSLHFLTFNNDAKYLNQILVDGYIHRINHILLPNQIVPSIIHDICFKFCFSGVIIHDGWHKTRSKNRDQHIGELKTLHYPNNIITSCNWQCIACYLKVIVMKGIHKWRFKLINGAEIIIGIVKTDIINYSKDRYPWEQPHYGYCFSTLLGKLTHVIGFDEFQYKYPVHKSDTFTACKQDDVVEMCLDFNSKSLSYSINDKSYGKAFDIDESKQYKICVRIDKKGQGVQFLDHLYFSP